MAAAIASAEIPATIVFEILVIIASVWTDGRAALVNSTVRRVTA